MKIRREGEENGERRVVGERRGLVCLMRGSTSFRVGL